VIVLEKACACVLRRRGSLVELLTFLHPLAPAPAALQLPKGTLEDGEGAETAVLRELREESGIEGASVAARIGRLEFDVEVAEQAGFPAHRQVWHLFEVEVPGHVASRERWDHSAEGSSEETGLVFSYRWTRLDDTARATHPIWRDVFATVRRHAAGVARADG
jgi:8-oxo-dGTP pyrophosphatase MutT (NUDIX family)